MTPSHLILSDLERPKSWSLGFQSLIHVPRKGHYLGPMLPLNINRMPYMGSSMPLLNLTLSDLERSVKATQIFHVGDLYGIHIFASSLLLT